MFYLFYSYCPQTFEQSFKYNSTQHFCFGWMKWVSLFCTDMPHSHWKACCDDNGLWSKGQSTCQPQWHHHRGQTHQPEVNSLRSWYDTSESVGTDAELFCAITGWMTWFDLCTLRWIPFFWMPGNSLCLQGLLHVYVSARKCIDFTNLFFEPGPQHYYCRSVTWYWWHETPVTCLAVWTGSTNHCMQPRITWSCWERRL